MSNLFTLFGTIAVNADSANRTIDSTTRNAEHAGSKMNGAFERIGNAAKRCGKAIMTGMAVKSVLNATQSLLKATLGSFAEYEQLVGGIETLFGESNMQKVLDYANQAYKTAGMSANEYMETVTSFSASLLQGLGGDTERAADYANMAITDMSDNANKMGTDISMIQNAYQGFAKQNYTMLDNLKLGYGGTAEEMARLVNDSGVLGAAITVDAKSLKQVPFHKIIDAINVIQDRMGIAGTTLAEATDTISGSFSALGATWTNLLTGLASGDQDIEELVDNVLQAGENLARNVFKVLPSLMQNLGKAASKLLQSVGQKLSKVWTGSVWPWLQETLKAKLGIDLPAWSEISGTLTSWWKTINESCGFLLRLFGVEEWTDEDKKAVEKWWSDAGVVLKFILGLPTDEEDKQTIKDINKWWDEKIKAAVSLTFQVLMPSLDSVAEWFAGIFDRLFPGLGILDTFNKGQEAYENSEWKEDFENDPIGTFTDTGSKLAEKNEEAGVSNLDLFKMMFTGEVPNVGVGEVGSDAHGGGAGKSFGTEDIVITHGGGAGKSFGADANDIAAAVRDAVAGIQFSVMLDTGVLVGQLAPQMDASLGQMAGRKGRRF
jgi:hypothetical protein